MSHSLSLLKGFWSCNSTYYSNYVVLTKWQYVQNACWAWWWLFTCRMRVLRCIMKKGREKNWRKRYELKETTSCIILQVVVSISECTFNDRTRAWITTLGVLHTNIWFRAVPLCTFNDRTRRGITTLGVLHTNMWF